MPGAIDGWAKLLDRFGTMKFKQVLEPAIRDADQGFPLTERIHTDWRSGVSLLRRDPDSAAVYLKDNQAPPLYSIVRNPDLANTFRILQKKGRDAFYKGEIAKAIVAKVRALGGVMSLSDLSEFESEWVDPISTNYHGYDVYQLPPNGQGIGVLEMLNILEVCAPKLGLNLATLGAALAAVLAPADRGQEARLHRPREVRRRPALRDVPVAKLNSKEYAATLCARSTPAHASQPGHLGRPRGRHRLHRHGRPLGQHGLVHPQRLRRLRSRRDGPGLRLPAAQPRRAVHARPDLAERRRPAQAAVPHDHPGVRDEGRRSP